MPVVREVAVEYDRRRLPVVRVLLEVVTSKTVPEVTAEPVKLPMVPVWVAEAVLKALPVWAPVAFK